MEMEKYYKNKTTINITQHLLCLCCQLTDKPYSDIEKNTVLPTK